MTTTPQPNRPADTSTTVAELATILDTVALIRVTKPRDQASRTTKTTTHWLTGVNRVTQIPTRDGAQYEIANSGFSLTHLPGDHTVDIWLTPTPTPAPAPAAQWQNAALQQQHTQPQYTQPTAYQQPTAQPQPHYTPQPTTPPSERAAAPWMNPPEHRAPAAPQQPTAPAYPNQGHHPQHPQQGGTSPGMR
ncbi:hypothetical protein PUR49_08070 [Streptomyces sp. BE147]|uniref:hypothetical protein n=1 Tax=Streptomyces sp. BE147 TaxID=3002524 RepID=UPI002E785F32|nr:hypothetical protein [Streptomyces sp. BE147]MEE1736454.1 hypothetical protein [Streptomyces sp. BE147]